MVKTTKVIPPAKKSVKPKVEAPLKFRFGCHLLNIKNQVQYFPAGTEYNAKLVRVRGFVTSCYVINGEQWFEI